MNRITGRIDVLEMNAENKKRPAKVFIKGEIYSTFFKDKLVGFNAGDNVVIAYSVSGEFKNLERIKLLESAPQKFNLQPDLNKSAQIATLKRIKRDVETMIKELERELK